MRKFHRPVDGHIIARTPNGVVPSTGNPPAEDDELEAVLVRLMRDAPLVEAKIEALLDKWVREMKIVNATDEASRVTELCQIALQSPLNPTRVRTLLAMVNRTLRSMAVAERGTVPSDFETEWFDCKLRLGYCREQFLSQTTTKTTGEPN